MNDFERAMQREGLAARIYSAAALYLLDSEVPQSAVEVRAALQAQDIGVWVDRPANGIFGPSSYTLCYGEVYVALMRLAKAGIAETGKYGPGRFFWYRRTPEATS